MLALSRGNGKNLTRGGSHGGTAGRKIGVDHRRRWRHWPGDLACFRARGCARGGGRCSGEDGAGDRGADQRRRRAGDVAHWRCHQRQRRGGDGEVGGRRLWRVGLRIQQCRHRGLPGGRRREEDRGLVGSFVRPDDRGQPEGRLALHEARTAADGRTGRRCHRQHRLDRRTDRPADVFRLRRGEARRGGADQDRGAGIRRGQDPGECGLSGLHRDEND